MPYFDSVDRIEKENNITWYLTQRFTTRKTDQNNINTYHELAWIRFYQTYDINKQRDDNNRPFSDISFEGELTISKYLVLDSQLDYNPYDHHFTSNESGVTLSDLRGDSIHAEYRYKRGISESVLGVIKIMITDYLSTYYSHEQDLSNNISIESKIGLELKRACWSLITSISDTKDDKAITILIKLHGIGGFGTQ